jgi:hypothetical protein
VGTITAIEGYVELGMTTLQAITAGTRNGAIACKMQKDLGIWYKLSRSNVTSQERQPR